MCTIIVVTMVGCARPVTESECDRAYTALIDAKTKNLPVTVKAVDQANLEKQRPAFLAACVGKADRNQLECWYRATDQKQLKACEAP
ncbi:MAG: hypothetical protein VX589_12270 [Myxococcota bacterium]|nr:hypothetical protein [Myxococcota bacterium]